MSNQPRLVRYAYITSVWFNSGLLTFVYFYTLILLLNMFCKILEIKSIPVDHYYFIGAAVGSLFVIGITGALVTLWYYRRGIAPQANDLALKFH